MANSTDAVIGLLPTIIATGLVMEVGKQTGVFGGGGKQSSSSKQPKRLSEMRMI